MLMNILKDLLIPIRNGKVKRGCGYMFLSGETMSLFCVHVSASVSAGCRASVLSARR
jgi:hypothetical protein